MKPEDDNQKSLVSEAVEAFYGSKADKVVVSSEDKARSSDAEEEYAHGEELASGKWLRLTIFRNPRTGSVSYRVSGQLPLYEGKPRLDLLDRQNRPVLIPGEVPRPLRDNYPTEGKAWSFLYRLEQAYNGVAVKSQTVETHLPEERVRQYEALEARLKLYLEKDPEAIEAAGDLYIDKYGNLIKPIKVQALYEIMVDLEKPYLGEDWLDKIGVAVNAVCRGCGQPSGTFDHTGGEKYDMDLGEVTADGLKKHLKSLPYKRAKEILRPFHRFLKFAKEQNYVRRNVAEEVQLRQTLDEKMKQAMAEIAIDNLVQVQIALNVAAKYVVGSRPPGYFVPHVVLMYYAAMRPISELRQMNPLDVRLHKKLIRLWSTKKMRRRIKSLPANAVAMLDYYWDGNQLSFEGWDQFWKLVQAAQGYDVKYPAWFKAPQGPRLRPKSDVPRHTGCSHGINRFKNPWDAVREDGHNWDIFRDFYDGLVPREETAIFCSLFCEGMPVSDKLREAVLGDLIEHELLGKDDPLPAPPKVPDFDVTPPQRQLWLPTDTDEVLRNKIWKSNVETVARQLGTDQPWLSAICRAKRIPMPKAGRSSREHPEAAPLPPPLITMPHDKLEGLIEKLHGVAPAARKLGVLPLHLSAYCAVYGIPVPNAHARALYYNNQPKIRTSRAQVKALLASSPSLEAAATKLKVTPEHLRDYCQRHSIQVDAVSKPANVTTLDEIKLSVTKEIDSQPRRPFTNVEAMELVLSKAPEGLSEEDLARVVVQVLGVSLTGGAIKYVVKESAKGRFERRHGRIRLIGIYETKIDLEHLKSLVKGELHRRSEWSLIEALRCAIPKTPKGLSLDQLLELLPLFGLNLDRAKVKNELKRLDRQSRVTFYYNQVTLPEGSPNWKLRVHDKEPTPGLEAITKRVQQSYAGLASRHMTNVEIMSFILSMAPDGLWCDEVLDIAKSCGIDMKASCIHSVVEHEAKGQFKRENGRVRFIGALEPKATKEEIHKALTAANGACVSRADLVLEVLKHFPRGLDINELHAAAELRGHKCSRNTFRRNIYYLAKAGSLKVEDGRVRRIDGSDGEGSVGL